MKTRHPLFLVLALSIAGVACDEDPTDPAVESLSLRPVLLRIVEGQTSQLDIEVRGAGGDFEPHADVRFGTLDSTIATVDDRGLLTAHSAGWTSVWVESDGLTDTTVVAVSLHFDRLLENCGVSSGQLYCFRFGDMIPSVDDRTRELREGRGFDCGITEDDRVYCTGGNQYLELGAQLDVFCSFGSDCEAEPLPTLRFKAVSVGGNHACAITTSDALYCWGGNYSGAVTGVLAEGCQPEAGDACGTLPVFLGQYTAVATGDYHTCAVRSDGVAECWGRNREGQLGAGVADDEIHAKTAIAGIAWDTIVAHDYRTCGLSSEGTRYCWGTERSGTLGLGELDDTCVIFGSPAPCALSPTSLPGEQAFTQITLGHAGCGLDAGGTAHCWGMELEGMSSLLSPAPLPAGVPLVEVDVDATAWCALDVNGGMHCWNRQVHPRQLVDPPTEQPLPTLEVTP